MGEIRESAPVEMTGAESGNRRVRDLPESPALELLDDENKEIWGVEPGVRYYRQDYPDSHHIW